MCLMMFYAGFIGTHIFWWQFASCGFPCWERICLLAVAQRKKLTHWAGTLWTCEIMWFRKHYAAWNYGWYLMGCVRPGIFADCIPNRHLTRIKQKNITTSTRVTKGRCHSSEQGCHIYWLFLFFPVFVKDHDRSCRYVYLKIWFEVIVKTFLSSRWHHPFTSIFVICLECTNFQTRKIGQTTWSETNLHNIYWKYSENNSTILFSIIE